MSQDEPPEDLLNQLGKVISLCEENNVHPKNLEEGEFVPENTQKEYNELKNLVSSYEDISKVKVDRYLRNNIELDKVREAKHYLWDIAVVEKENIAFEEYPDLKKDIENSLKKVPSEADMNKNGFEFRDHYLIFCSRLYRNYYLVGKLNTIRSDEIELSVPISYSRLGIPETTREYILAAHWRGPETIDELRSRSGNEFFVQKGTESYEQGLQDRTEFYFERRNDRWHLQIEELLPRTGINYSLHANLRDRVINYYTRYLHAVVDEDCKQCFHMDGALREYGDLEDFVDRHVEKELSDSNQLKKMSNRYKLFKLDSKKGKIEDFGEVAGLFFKRNPHVQRFFEGDSEYADEIEQKRASSFESDFSRNRVAESLSN
jgi:hypothetical protein